MDVPNVAQQLYGRRIREQRVARRLSQEALAREVTCTAPYISLIEKGTRLPDETVAERLDTALEASGALVEDWRLLDGVRRRRSTLESPETSRDEVDDVKRREAIAALAAVGAGAGSIEPLERVSELLNEHLDPRADYAVEEWEHAPYEYSEALKSRPLHDIRRDIALDLVELDRLVSRPSITAATIRRLLRCSALLSGVLAIASVRLDETRQARRWWATATVAANRAEDAETWTWLRSQEAVMGMYSGWSPQRVLSAADEVVGRPGAAWLATAGALSARAQALAQLSRDTEAVQALTALERHTTETPQPVEGSSPLHWTESRTRHTESFVYTFVKDVERARVAQQRYFTLSSTAHPNQVALVKLHEATCIAREDLAEGSQEFARLIADHPDGQVVALGRQLEKTVPRDPALPASQEMRLALESPDHQTGS